MFELVISNEVIRLGSLAAAGSSEEEEDVGFGKHAEVVGLFLIERRGT